MDKGDTRHTTFTQDTEYVAVPYDISARNFFFADADDYWAKRKTCRNGFGAVVEEFEINYIGNDALTHAVFEALSINQGTIIQFLDRIDAWDDDQKIKLVIAVGECGYGFDLTKDDPDDFDVDLYPEMTLKELAAQFVDEGLFGEIPERLAYYLDYDAIARDLAHDYAETTIAGTGYLYRMA